MHVFVGVYLDESMLDSFRERRYSTTSQVSLEEQMDFLQEKLQMLQGHTGSQCRRKEKTLRKELSMLRRQQKHERKTSGECVCWVRCACVHETSHVSFPNLYVWVLP